MKVTILSHTPAGKIVAATAFACYSKISATQIMDNFSQSRLHLLIKTYEYGAYVSYGTC